MANNPVELLEKPLVDLLGLKNDPGMTYEDYFSALKEAAVAAQMNTSKYSSEQAESIREELKRIREKFKSEPEIRKKDFKFKIKSVKVKGSKINKDNVSTINTPKLTGKTIKFDAQKFLPKSVEKKFDEEPTEQQTEPQRRRPTRRANPLIKILNNISRKLDSILSTLKSQSALDVRNTERQRRDRERDRRSAQESSMEGLGSGIKAIANVGKKMLAPLENIWDRIVRFFTFVFLGRAFFAFMKWMSDPDNKKKFDIIVNFLSKHWLAIVGAYILFGTSLGGLVRFLLKAVIRMTAGMLKVIPRLLSVIAKSKFGRLGLAATALFTAGAVIPKLFPKTVDEQERNVAGQKGTNQEKIEKLKAEKNNLNFFERYVQGKGSEIDEQIHKLQTGENKAYGLSNGGIIPSFMSGGLLGSRMGIPVTGAKGDDTIIAAKRGEAVLTERDQKDIQQKYGLNIPQYLSGRRPSTVNLENVKPKTGGYFGGGIVQGYKEGGIVGGSANKKPTNPKISDADYHALMAMTALEADEPQGRSDVAQSIYNRLHGATTKGINFLQNTNTIKDIITAGGGRKDGGQYEPSFDNKLDWYNIRDLDTAAIAVMNSSKGKRYKWTLQDAINQIKATELALKDPALQKSSQKFVGGRTDFYGTSEQEYMKPWEGDVLRNKNSNYFVANRNLPINSPGPIPEVLLPKIQNPTSPNNKKGSNKGFNPVQNISNFISGIFSRPQQPVAKSKPGSKPTKPGSKPQRAWWDPRGWVGKKGGGSVNKTKSMKLAGSLIKIAPIDTMPDRTMTGFRDLAQSQYSESLRNKSFGRTGVQGLKGGGDVGSKIESTQRVIEGNRVENFIRSNLPDTMSAYYEQQRDSGIPTAPLTPSQIEKGIYDKKMKTLRQLMQLRDQNKGGGLIKRKGGGSIPDRFEPLWDGPNDAPNRPEPLWDGPNDIAIPKVPLIPNRPEPLWDGPNDIVIPKVPLIPNRPEPLWDGPNDTPDRSEPLWDGPNDIAIPKVPLIPNRPEPLWDGPETSVPTQSLVSPPSISIPPLQKSLLHTGFVNENSGMDFPGGTADRQATLLQPGEYVIPKATVSAFGGKGFFDTLTALTDVNSEPAKMGLNSKDISSGIKPYDTGNAGKPEFIKLPPINSSNSNSGADMSESLMGSKEVFFSPICQVDHAQSERQRILDTLGVLTN